MAYETRVRLGRPGIERIYVAMTRRERFWFRSAVLNFVVFVSVTISFGGNALNGGVRNGHYFLMMGGVYTQVSRPVFIYSAIHSLSVIVTWPIGVLIALRAALRARKSGN